MIVATILMLCATFICYPFVVSGTFCLRLDDICANIEIKVGIARVLRLKLFVKKGKLLYEGTICGEVEANSGGKVKIRILEWQQIDVFVGLSPSQLGVVLLSTANMALAIARCLGRNVGLKTNVNTAFGDKTMIACKIRCKVSLMSLLGVG